MPRFENPGTTVDWHDWILCRFLIEEAQETVNGTKSKEPIPTKR
jgi:hypothetical protein